MSDGSRIAILLAATCGLLPALTPTIERLEPPGAQRGKTIRLVLHGRNLPKGAKIISSIPGSFTPLAKSSANGESDDSLAFLAELRADAAVGLYPLRVQTPQGLSNLLLFSVGEFDEVEEVESPHRAALARDDSLAAAQELELPVVVNGRLSDADRDVFRFEAKVDERIVLEVEARRAGSAIDPVLRVLDSEGTQLAMNNDAWGVGLDSRLLFRAPAQGAYYVVVHDARYSEQAADFYRLKIGDYDYADGFFPLGGQRGETVEVEWFGGTLSEPVHSKVDLSGIPAGAARTLVSTPGRSGALPAAFVVGERKETLESSDRSLQSGRVVNGRISATAEVDRYELEVGAGSQWRISVDAARLGGSRLFALLSIYDQQGTLLAGSGDEIPQKGTTTLEENTLVSRDPFLLFEPPKGVTQVVVAVEDLIGRGGAGFSYRLLAEQGPADFELSLNTPFVNVPAGGTVYVTATAVRRGYGGPIRLMVEGADDSIEVEGGHISASFFTKDLIGVSGSGSVAITAKRDAEPVELNLSVWGEAVGADGVVLRRKASGPGLVTSVASRKGIRARQLPVRADWLNMDLPAMTSIGLPVRLAIDSPAKVRIVKGVEYPLRWKLLSDDPAIKKLSGFRLSTAGARETTFSPRDPEADFDGESYVKYLRTTMGGPEQSFDVTLTAEVTVNGVKERIAAPIINVEVVQGYVLETSEDDVEVHPGEIARISGKVVRDPAFGNAVVVEASELPEGVACGSASLPPSESSFVLECEVQSSVEAGSYRVLIQSSSTMAGRGEGKDVPYKIDPVPVSLVVSP